MKVTSPLSFQDEQNFLCDGYIVVRNVFDPQIGKQYCDLTWQCLGEDPEQPSAEFCHHPQLEQVIESGPIDQLITPRLFAAVDQLVGTERWWTRRGCGWVTVRLPQNNAAVWTPPRTGWHVDGIHFHHRLESKDLALVGIELLTPSHRHGGATMVRRASHLSMAQALHRAGSAGLSYTQMRDLAESLDSLDAVEITGAAGDVLLMHPLLAHARSMNCTDTARMAANRAFVLHQPKSVYGPASGSFSLMEQAIRQAIGLS